MPHRTDDLKRVIADTAEEPEKTEMEHIILRSHDGCSFLDALRVCAIVWNLLRHE
jgi:hypothetical protein